MALCYDEHARLFWKKATDLGKIKMFPGSERTCKSGCKSQHKGASDQYLLSLSISLSVEQRKNIVYFCQYFLSPAIFKDFLGGCGLFVLEVPSRFP